MFPFSPPSLLLLASLHFFFQISIIHAEEETLCNGHTSLCSRPYSNITFIGAHNSAFIGSSPADNQGISITAQLDSGIRFLQSQTHTNSFQTLSLCHTSCFLNDAGPLTAFLTTIKTWLDANPNEVLTLLLTNADRTPIAQYASAFESTGLDKYTFAPPTTNPLPLADWPTLGSLISSKTRLIVFLDYGASPSTVPYILDEFAYFFETPFNTLDPTFSQCSLDRPPNAKPDGRMYIVNHFLDKKLADGGGGIAPAPDHLEESGKGILEDLTRGVGQLFGKNRKRMVGEDIVIPDREAAPRTNAVGGRGGIQAQVDLCKGLYQRNPNVVLLDFVDEGEGVEAQRVLNGL
ncbi:MAG: hypothetical protein Q9171_006897 [Xanthocarpia ochracea]